VKKQLSLVAVFVVVAASLGTGISSGQPNDPDTPAARAAPAPNPPVFVPPPAAPAQGLIQFGGRGGGGGGVGGGGFSGAVPGQAQIPFDPRNGAVRVWGGNVANGFSGPGNLTVNAIPDQNPKATEIAQVMHDLRTSESPAEKADLKMRLGNAITDYFDDDLKSRETELANLEERLMKLRNQLDRRRAAKAEIVQLQLKVLVNDAEGLGFSSESDSRPGPSPVPTSATYYVPGTSRQAAPPPGTTPTPR
jgi:hypothetical protein